MGEPTSGSNYFRLTSVEIQVTRNLFFIFLAYILCLTPQAVCTIFTCGIDENYTRFIVALNSVVNPFIYGLNHPVFRQVFISIFKCKAIPEPSSFLTNLTRKMNDLRSSLESLEQLWFILVDTYMSWHNQDNLTTANVSVTMLYKY